jgi:hypothetical protein
VITASAGLLTALATGRNQRAMTRVQLEHDEKTSLRQERRAIFVEFLEAYDQVFRKALALMVDADGKPNSTFQKVAKAEIDRLMRAYMVVMITAGPAARAAADESIGTLWHLGDAAAVADQETYELALEESRRPRHRVRAAMRAELGVEEVSG